MSSLLEMSKFIYNNNNNNNNNNQGVLQQVGISGQLSSDLDTKKDKQNKPKERKREKQV